jgi:DNA-binding SARP family transcriptional activator
MLAEKRSLLSYAFSKLNPDIFSHPVWIRFGRRGITHALAMSEEVLRAAKEIEHEDPCSTCQILLVGAVYQNSAGQNGKALETIGLALDLAKRTCFTSGEVWAHWAGCAICFQQGKYGMAVSHIEALEAALTDQNEWMLAAYLEVIKQSINQMETSHASWHTDPNDGSSFEELIYFTYSWLQNWGVNFQTPEPNGRRKSDYWHAPEFFHKWGMKFYGNSKERKQFSVWKSVLSLLRLQAYRGNPAPQAGQEELQRNAGEIPPTVKPPIKDPEPGIDLSTKETNSPKPKDSHKTKSHTRKKPDRITMTVQMLGPFTMTIEEFSPRLPASRALSVFKYLLLHHSQSIPREVLMDVFWPEAGPEAARNNLNVAIHNLRQTLLKVTEVAVICFEEGAYHLAPGLDVWLDVEEFDHCVKEGKQLESNHQLTSAVAEYQIAINLYRGDLLSESPYEEWMVLERERLRIAYLDTLDHLSRIYFSQKRYAACVTLCQVILNHDNCREDIHSRLMQCHSRLGQTSLALRQYQICVEALQGELDIEPTSETTQLYQQLRRHKDI